MNDILNIDFERSGGFAGIPVRVILDGSLLSQDEVAEIRKMIENADFFNLQVRGTSDHDRPDQFLYRIKVETTEFSHTLILYEQEVTADLRPLIRFLSGKTRRGRGK